MLDSEILCNHEFFVIFVEAWAEPRPRPTEYWAFESYQGTGPFICPYKLE